MNDTLTENEVAKVQEILMHQLQIRREQIKPEAKLTGDLGADSLDVVEIAMKSEEEFGFTLPDEEAEKVVTVEDLYDAVAKMLGRA